MTTVFILSCLLWVKGDFTKVLEIPVSEYAMANLSEEKSGFLFEADVIEERMNSMKITYLKQDVSTMVYAYDSAQKSLVAKLNVGTEEASLSCEVKKYIRE